MALFIARFKNVKGRFLVSDHDCPGGYGGQKILNARQEKYGNKPDPASGLYLDEMYRVFSASEVESIKPLRRA